MSSPGRPVVALVPIALSLALAGCAAGIARGDAAPLVPMDNVDRVSSVPSARIEAAGLPEWLRLRLADYDAQPGPAAPRVVWALRYAGATAYLVQAGCCDQFDPLVDERGVLICHPSGGFTGRGDGKCPAPLPPASERREVWRHR